MTGKSGLILFTFLIVNLSLSTHATEVDEASLMIQTFGSQCSSVNPKPVQHSLGTIQSLISTIRAIQANSNCANAAGVEQTLRSYDNLYQEYLVYSELEEKRRKLELDVSRFSTLQSQGTLDLTLQSYLELEIYNSQVELISTNSELERFSSFSNNRAFVASQLLIGIEGLLATAGADASCFDSAGQVASSITSNGLIAASAFTSPGTSLGLSTLGVIIQSLTRFRQSSRFNDAAEAFDNINTPTAVRCVSEAITERYCEAVDTMELLDTYRNDLENSEPTLQGIKLLSQGLRNLDHWLKEVYAGSEITSEGDLINREKPIKQSELLKKVLRYLQAYKSEQEKTLSRLSDSDRSPAIAIAIRGLVLIMAAPNTVAPDPATFRGADSDNPIFATRTLRLLPYQIYDPSLSQVPLCSGGSECRDFTTFISNNPNISLTIADWNNSYANALKIVNAVLGEVNIERAQTVSVDAFSVVTAANKDTNNGPNAIQGLIKVQNYSKEVAINLTLLGCINSNDENCFETETETLPEITHPYYPQIINIQRTHDLTTTLIGLIKEAYRPRSITNELLPEECSEITSSIALKSENFNQIEEKAFTITSCITKILKLDERGNDVYFAKIRNVVDYDLQARLKNEEFSGNMTSILKATRTDLVTSLRQTFTQGNELLSLGEVYTGLETAQTIADQSLAEFTTFYRNGIISALKRDLKPREKADLCFRILPTLRNEDNALIVTAWNACKDIRLNFYSEGPRLIWKDFMTLSQRNGQYVVSVNQFRKKKERFCALRNYNRMNRLIDEYKSN